MKNIRVFYLKVFSFLEVQFSIDLNRRVFVMPPVLKYLIVYNLLNFPPILIKFVSKFYVCKVLYFKAQYLLRLRSPLNTGVSNLSAGNGPIQRVKVKNPPGING